MRWAAVALPLLILAGCADDPPAPLAPEDGGRTGRAPAEEGGLRTFDASFDLVLNPDDQHLLVVNILGGSPNCVVFTDGEAPGYRLVGGNATLSWDPLTPLAEELLVTASGITTPVRASGTSPLVLDLTGAELDAAGTGISFMADHEVPQIPVRQPAKLHVTLDYQGELPTPLPAFCTNGLL